jgi:Tfp pilus assembly pilus retraction ATPase PilT
MRQAVRNLSEVPFDDLYVPAQDGVPFLIRNLDPGSPGGPVRPLPDPFRADATGLRSALLQAWERRGRPDEFSLSHNHGVYRAALIRTEEAGPEPGPGWTWCLRRLSTAPFDLDQMGIPKSVTDQIRSLSKERGLILVSGAFGSGKTTTASSCLRAWVRETGEVGVTLEDPPEVPLGHVSAEGAIYQVEIPEHDFPAGVRAARRWGPRYVLMGDVQSPEAAKELLRISLSGPMVVSTIHASDPVRAIINLVSFASDVMSEELARDMVAEAIQAVLHQERRSGRLMVRLATVSGRDDFARRNLIRRGRFELLNEAFGLTVRKA